MAVNTMNLMPGCQADCPCADCVIQQSDFAGTASTTVTGFTELLADWAIDGAGGLNVTGPALIKGDTAHPDGAAGNQNVTVQFTGEGTGIVRAAGVVGLVDANNYLKGEVTIDDAGCDSLRLYKVSGGTATQLGDSQPIIGAVLGAEYELQVCWQPGISSGSGSGAGTLRARVSGGSLEFTYGNQADTTSTGAYGGLAVAAGQVTFRQYRFKYMRDDVDKQNCPTCNTACPISADDFSDAAKSACLWSGSFSVSGGKLNTTGRTKHLVFHPQLKGTMAASASLLDGASLGPVTLSINDDDAGAALEAVYQTDTDSRTLTISRDGVELDTVTQNGVTFPDPAVETSFEACFDGHTFSAEVAGLCVLQAATPIPGGKWAALDGTATWDNFTLGKTKSLAEPVDRCERCGCTRQIVCSTACCGTYPIDDAYLVDLGPGGWTARGCGGAPPNSCDACEDAQGDFIVEQGPLGGCSWDYSGLKCDWGACTGGGDPTFNILLELVRYTSGPYAGQCRWRVKVSLSANVFDSFVCQDEAGNFVSNGAPVGTVQQVAYLSDPLSTDLATNPCNVMPVSLIRQPFGTGLDDTFNFCPCGGELPDTITLRKI